MKFLCVTCDEPMKLAAAEPSTGGHSIAAVFACPSCAHQIAMLTNPQETQLVQSLGVKIGPDGARTPGAEAEGGSCPFAGLVAEAEKPGVRPPGSGPAEGISWAPQALARLEKIPEFVRPMAKQGIEQYARTHGHTRIDDEVMAEARSRFGM